MVAAIDSEGFVFNPDGLAARDGGGLSNGRQSPTQAGELRGRSAHRPADALASVSFRTRAVGPVLVDVTADETTSIMQPAVGAGMDIVLANKRPLSGRASHARADGDRRRGGGQRMLFEATVGAGLPIFDTYSKLVESGDRVFKIEGCVSGTLGFVLTEIGAGGRSRRLSATRWTRATPSPTRVTIRRAPTSAARALILGACSASRGARRCRGRVAGPRRLSRCPPAFVGRLPSWTPTGARHRRRREGGHS